MARTRAAAVPPVVELPPGTLIAAGTVPGRAVSWCAPTIGRNGGATRTRGYAKFQAWQKAVHYFAALNRPRGGVYGGPVRLGLIFVLRPQPNGACPDVTNLQKAAEDALQGVIYANDKQVTVVHARRILSRTEPEEMMWKVTADE